MGEASFQVLSGKSADCRLREGRSSLQGDSLELPFRDDARRCCFAGLITSTATYSFKTEVPGDDILRDRIIVTRGLFDREGNYQLYSHNSVPHRHLGGRRQDDGDISMQARQG